MIRLKNCVVRPVPEIIEESHLHGAEVNGIFLGLEADDRMWVGFQQSLLEISPNSLKI